MRAILQTDAKRRALRVTMIEESVHDQLQAQRRTICQAICRGGRPAPRRDRADGPPGPVSQQRPPDPILAGSVERQPDRPAGGLGRRHGGCRGAVPEPLFPPADRGRACRCGPLPRASVARSACLPCRSWPGPCWRRPSFGSTTDLDSFEAWHATSDARPRALSTRRPTDALLLCVRISGPHDLTTVVPGGGLGWAGSGVGVLGHGPAGGLGRARATGAASALGLAGTAAPVSSRPGTPSPAPTPAARSDRSRPRCRACGSRSSCR